MGDDRIWVYWVNYKAGQDLYFAQQDSRSSGEVVYRMRVRESSADRIVLELENVTPVRLFIVTLFSPGDMKFVYFLERRVSGNWGTYALLSANSSYAEGNEASFINRAAAFYRHFTGAPTAGALNKPLYDNAQNVSQPRGY